MRQNLMFLKNKIWEETEEPVFFSNSQRTRTTGARTLRNRERSSLFRSVRAPVVRVRCENEDLVLILQRNSRTGGPLRCPSPKLAAYAHSTCAYAAKRIGDPFSSVRAGRVRVRCKFGLKFLRACAYAAKTGTLSQF